MQRVSQRGQQLLIFRADDFIDTLTNLIIIAAKDFCFIKHEGNANALSGRCFGFSVDSRP